MLTLQNQKNMVVTMHAEKRKQKKYTIGVHISMVMIKSILLILEMILAALNMTLPLSNGVQRGIYQQGNNVWNSVIIQQKNGYL